MDSQFQKTTISVITDLHFKNKANPVLKNQLERQDEFCNYLLDILRTRRQNCDRHITILLGDLGERLSDIQLTKLALFLEDLRKLGEVYGVIGNHEITYGKKGCAYLHFAYGDSQIDKQSVEKLRPLIKVVDYLDINNTRLAFWHYGRRFPKDIPDTIQNYFVFGHNALMSQELQTYYIDKGIDTQEKYVEQLDLLETIPKSSKLKGIYLGHLHTLVGNFRVQETVENVNMDFRLYQLGSLLLSKHSEFDIDPVRYIPQIDLLQDSNFECDEEPISLFKNKEDCVNLSKVHANQEKYKENKGFNDLKKQRYSSTDPIGELLDSYSEEPELKTIITECIETIPNKRVDSARKNMDSILEEL